MGLIDLGATGLPFMWNNKRMDTGAIFERYDRALSNYQRLKLYSSATVQNLPIVDSDHAPILLNIADIHTHNKHSYLNLRLIGSLIQVSLNYLKNLVINNGSHAFQLDRKIHMLRQPIKS